MTRIAIIGNSHVGAPRFGWERVRERFPDVDVEFFSAPGRYFPLLELTPERRLHFPDKVMEELGAASAALDRINGRRGVDLAASDLVIWVGYGWPTTEIDDLAATYDVDGLPAAGNARHLSQAAFDAVCDALVEETLPPAEWRGWSAPRLVLGLRPMRALPAEGKRARRLQGSPGRRAAVRAARDRFLDRLRAALDGAGVGLFPQPDETLTPFGATRMEFSRGAVRMRSGKEFPPEDNSHMNADFGRLWWERLLAWLETRPSPASPPHRAA